MRARGTVYRSKDNTHWVVRLTLADGGKSKPIHLPPEIEHDKARETAAQLHDRQRERERTEKAPPDTTWDGWAARWFAYRRKRGHTSTRQDEGRWKKWISPAIGRVAVQATGKEHMRALVEKLDAAQRAEKIQPKTAKLTWGVMTSAGRECCSSKRDDLRVRDTNPCAGVIGPDNGPERETTWLYPVEAERLFRCSRVPLRWRQLAALAIGLYARPGEMETIGPDDVDLAADVVLVHQATDPTRKGSTKRTKTGTTRRVPIEPMIRPLVVALVDLARAESRDRLVKMPPESDLAEWLRIYLRRAGCDRAELYANDRARRPLRWRDLRNTGITWRALRGDTHSAIQRAAGHERFETTERYIKAAEDLGLGVGTPFPSLPRDLLDVGHLSDTRALCASETALNQAKMAASPAGFESTTTPAERALGDADPQIWTPFGAIATSEAHEIAAAVSGSDIPPAALRAEVRAVAALMVDRFDRGDVDGAREAWRDLGEVIRYGGERRRGSPRYETHPDTGETLTVSAWARRLGLRSQTLTYRLDKHGVAVLRERAA